jgi:hypothetical protein
VGQDPNDEPAEKEAGPPDGAAILRGRTTGRPDDPPAPRFSEAGPPTGAAILRGYTPPPMVEGIITAPLSQKSSSLR